MTGCGWAGLLWENKYYERANFVIFIALGSMCVCVLLDRRHCTNTKYASMQCAYIQLLIHNTPMLMLHAYVNMQTRATHWWNIYAAADASTAEGIQSISALNHTIPLIFYTLVMSVIVYVCIH